MKPPTHTEILDMLTENNVISHGHFLLSSGLHSNTYVQCAELSKVPKILEKFCAMLISKIKSDFTDIQYDHVISPAYGGILIGYEVARQLDKTFFFCEKVLNEDKSKMMLALRKERGFVLHLMQMF